MPRVGILAAADGWHIAELRRALEARGCEAVRLDPTRVGAAAGGAGAPPRIVAVGRGPRADGGPADDAPLEALDALLVRVVPPGSLDQIVFRIDALHLLADRGHVVVNGPRCLERTIDKHWTTRLLADAGIATPRTFVTERADRALQAFGSLGDVVVKPLLGSGGRGLFRVSDPDLAWRAFRTLEQQRAVIYMQEFVPHHRHDLRLFVAGGRIVAAARRDGDSWKSNLAAGAVARAHVPTDAQADLARRAAAIVEADYAGVDLLEAEDGRLLVTEVNGIPAWSGLQSTTRVDVAGAVVDTALARLVQRR
jgi:RimK family alpha-L-glutamate ligase